MEYLDNSVFRWYVCCSSALVIKMMFMTLFTGYQRFKHKAFINPEDATRMDLEPRTHEEVERARRAHINDLENISLFFVIGFLYTLTNPSEAVGKSLMLTYTLARIAHTLVYAVIVIPQPARAISFLVGFFITGFMAISSFVHFVS